MLSRGVLRPLTHRRVLYSLRADGPRSLASVAFNGNSLTSQDLGAFEGIVGARGVVTDPVDLSKFNKDWTGEFEGRSKVALLPSSTEQVQAILRHCHERDIKVVPQGGNTGLVGGSIPIHDEVILSMQRMNKIIGFDERVGSITCEAGVTLQAADEFARKRGHLMPLDLGSKGSCQVGGNLATNAGGIRLIKYGSLRGNVLGIQAVLSDGTLLDSMRPLRKDNVGYDLKQLLIGSEGTLGIITQCTILTPPCPASSSVALFALPSFGNALEMLVNAKRYFGSDLSAFEYFDRRSSQLVAKYGNVKNPLQETTTSPFFVVVEASGPEEGYVTQRLTSFAERLMERNLIENAVISESNRQYQELWALRETITSSLRASKMRVFKYDVSLPANLLHEATVEVTKLIRKDGFDDVEVFEYGHLGDGNLHFNAGCRARISEHVNAVQASIEKHLYGYVERKRGSISAEHGLGQLKAKKIFQSRSKNEVHWMKAIKAVLDPRNILNPGKVLI